MYRLTSIGIVIRLADEANIPPDPANRDYQAFLAWQAAGNNPEPALAPELPAEDTPRDILAEFDALKATLVERAVITAEEAGI